MVESRDHRTGAVALAGRAAARLRAGDAAAAATLAERALALARGMRLRSDLNGVLVWAAIAQHEPVVAHMALARMSESAIDDYLLAAYLSCCNRVDDAVQLLREARELGKRDADSTKLLIDLLYRQGDSKGALALARADDALLSADEQRMIATALAGGGT
jgi:hypothetical protein